MPDLKNKVALVTGASRGIGKGIALGLADAGATVYITARTVKEGTTQLPGTIYQTVTEIEQRGGKCTAIPCDHRDDEAVQAAFQHILTEHGHIDILVNNVWGGYEGMDQTWGYPFWEQPMWRWDNMFQSGVRAFYVASRLAAPSMIAHRNGLIVNISFWAGQKYMNNTAYGVAKIATDRLAADMAHELRQYNVATVSLYPGLVRTEGVMSAAEYFDLSNSKSPEFIGRAIAALAADPHIMKKSGQVLVAAKLALEYGFTDIDGKQPQPLTFETV